MSVSGSGSSSSRSSIAGGWYVRQLKARPILANMAGALVVMLVGDVAAQFIENHYYGGGGGGVAAEEEEEEDDYYTVLLGKGEEHHHHKLRYRRYGTLSPGVGSIQEELKQQQQQQSSQQRNFLELLKLDWNSIDLFRTGTMAFWAVCVSTPYYVGLYQVFDRVIWPGGAVTTPRTVAARVAMALMASIPLNALFFGYGCLVHHAAEWTSLLREWRFLFPEASFRHLLRENPFDAGLSWSAYRLKLETELPLTIVASGSMWIPINVLNFSVVPSHLRPVTLTGFTAFWNCYLSLAQHREAEIIIP